MIERLIWLLSANLGHTSQHSNDSDDFDLEVIVLLPRYLLIHHYIIMRVDDQMEAHWCSRSSEDDLLTILLGIVYTRRIFVRLRTEEKC